MQIQIKTPTGREITIQFLSQEKPNQPNSIQPVYASEFGRCKSNEKKALVTITTNPIKFTMAIMTKRGELYLTTSLVPVLHHSVPKKNVANIFVFQDQSVNYFPSSRRALKYRGQMTILLQSLVNEHKFKHEVIKVIPVCSDKILIHNGSIFIGTNIVAQGKETTDIIQFNESIGTLNEVHSLSMDEVLPELQLSPEECQTLNRPLALAASPAGALAVKQQLPKNLGLFGGDKNSQTDAEDTEQPLLANQALTVKR